MLKNIKKKIDVLSNLTKIFQKIII